MGLESTFDVIENSEMFISLFNSDNVHLTEWESWVSSEFAVNLDELGDHLHPKGGRSFTFRVMLGRRWRAARWGQPLGGYTPPLTPGPAGSGDARGVDHPGHASSQ